MSEQQTSDRGLTLAAWLGDEVPEGLTNAKVPRLVITSELTARSDLVVGSLLGEGGMATVHEARQVALDRDVAIKRVKDPRSPAAVRGLLVEAMLSARLRHPHILPIHMVGETEEGEPAVVMPVVSGVPWGDLPTPERTRMRHIEVFSAVCQAVSHAHEAGIVHRDIKPSNVRIGEQGEIYLLDWGIAAPMDGRLHASAGTPEFMAPEAREPVVPQPSLDIYGLAASLVAVLTDDIPRTEPDGGLCTDNLPRGLGRVLARAGAANPKTRHPSAGALRSDVLAWQEQQVVERLLDAGQRQLAVLTESTGAEARRQFTVARFAFEQVLESAPNNNEAADGLATCFDAIVRLELAEGQLGSAAGWLDSHPHPTPELRDEVASHEARAQAASAESARLSEVGRQLDLRDDRQAILRAILAIMAAVVLNVIGVAAWMGPPLPATDPEELSLRLVLLVAPTYLALLGAGGWLIRKLNAPAGARVVESFLALGALLLLGRVMAWRYGLYLQSQPAVLAFETLLPVAWGIGLSHLSARFFVAAGVGVLGWLAVLAVYASPMQGWVHNAVFLSTFAALGWAWLDVQRGLSE